MTGPVFLFGGHGKSVFVMQWLSYRKCRKVVVDCDQETKGNPATCMDPGYLPSTICQITFTYQQITERGLDSLVVAPANPKTA